MCMLDYLVTSKARRRMLQLLWGRGDSGSAAELAELAGVGFANAYRELHAMVAFDLATSTREHGAEVYRANRSHPLAAAVQALVATPPRSVDNRQARALRGQLRTLGAPLADAPARVPADALEETLVRGVRLAHRDATVARTLPVCLFRLRDRLSAERLHRCALDYGEKPALGFFLDLTAELGHDDRFRAWTERLRDRRRTSASDFFHSANRSVDAKQQAEEKAPACARRWGFHMNMDLDAFRSTFDRFAHAG